MCEQLCAKLTLLVSIVLPQISILPDRVIKGMQYLTNKVHTTAKTFGCLVLSALHEKQSFDFRIAQRAHAKWEELRRCFNATLSNSEK